MTNLYFIGGASGSGKTSVMKELQLLLSPAISVYDFDDMGVPDGADKKWRQETTEKWLKKLLDTGKDSCLLGQVVLGEILACPSAVKLEDIFFCLLDVHDSERIQRLQKRNPNDADQNMLNWASWLRMHQQDPQWAQQVIKDGAWEGMDFSIWDKESTWPAKVKLKEIDTTNSSIKEVGEQIAHWVQGLK
jgi:leucyl aminopeptidase (aminopeptidase T)